MTRKHFQDLADTILPMWDEMPPTYVKQFVLTLIPFLKRQNPRFDKQRFLDACGYIQYENEYHHNLIQEVEEEIGDYAIDKFL